MKRDTEKHQHGGMEKGQKVDVNQFVQLAKCELKQDAMHDFMAHSADGKHIVLIASKSELVTLQLTTKVTYHVPFPYICASYENIGTERPLDKLSRTIDLEEIYHNSDALQAHQISLDPVYMAVCSTEIPAAKLMAAGWCPGLLPNGQPLLGMLNSYGAFTLLTKPLDSTQWSRFHGLNIANILTDIILPPFEISAHKIKTFNQFQSYMDRNWITAFVWQKHKNSIKDTHTLVLGTASGSIIILILSANAQEVVKYYRYQSNLQRICYMTSYDGVLLVAAANGLLNLYQINENAEDGLCLIKELWTLKDRIGIIQAIITYNEEFDSYYIACSKSANFIVWCVSRSGVGAFMQEHMYAGGVKITAIAALGTTSFIVSTILTGLHSIKISHSHSKNKDEPEQIKLTKQPIVIDDIDNYQLVGISTSEHKNLLMLFMFRNQEYALSSPAYRHSITVSVGKLRSSNALIQLEKNFDPEKPINHYGDLLADIRMSLILEPKSINCTQYAALVESAFHEAANEKQLQQLQLKYIVLDAQLNMQQNCFQHTMHVEQTKGEIELLLLVLTLTHLRLRLQYLASLNELTLFQRNAAYSMFTEGLRICEKLKQQNLKGELKNLPELMTNHFEALQRILRDLLGAASAPAADLNLLPRCTVSYLELTPTLDQHYCTICGRKTIVEKNKLLELYSSESQLKCPFCWGAYTTELALL